MEHVSCQGKYVRHVLNPSSLYFRDFVDLVFASHPPIGSMTCKVLGGDMYGL